MKKTKGTIGTAATAVKAKKMTLTTTVVKTAGKATKTTAPNKVLKTARNAVAELTVAQNANVAAATSRLYGVADGAPIVRGQVVVDSSSIDLDLLASKIARATATATTEKVETKVDPAPCSVTPMQQNMQYIKDRLSELSQSINQLGVSIGPVLNSIAAEGEAQSDNGMAYAGNSEVAAFMRETAYNLLSLTTAVKELTSRVEV